MLSLHRGLVVSIFTEWIEIEDLAYFDSACCNFDWRSSFISLFLRKFKNIHVFNKIVEAVLNNLTHISHLEIDYGQCFSKIMTKFKNKIEKLDIEGKLDLDHNFAEVFSKLSGLQALNCFVTCLDSNDVSFENVAEYLTCLSFEQSYPNADMWLPNLKQISIYPDTDNEQLYCIAQCCPQLEHLDVMEITTATNEDLDELTERCPLLKHLKLNSNKITDKSVVKLIESHHSMVFLDLKSCHITDLSILAMANCLKYLKSLNVNKNDKLTSKGFIQLSRSCKLLESLKCNGCSIDNLVILELSKNNPQLTFLSCRDCSQVSDLFLSKLITNCDKLKDLYVHGTMVTLDTAIHFLQNIDALAILQGDKSSFSMHKNNHFRYKRSTICRACIFIPSTIVETPAYIMVTHLNPMLRVLNLTSLINVCDDVFIHMLTNCVRLEEVSICDCHLITVVGITHLVKAFNKIHTLTLSKMDINCDVMEAIFNNLSQLTVLNLSGCEMLGDEALMCISGESCVTLQHIDVSKCFFVTDAGIAHVVKHCQQLISLNGSECLQLTDCTLENISIHCGSKLHKINFNKCNKMTRKGLSEFICAFASQFGDEFEFECE